MLLCADIGNSHTVFGLVSQGRVASRWRVSTEERRTADEWAVLIRGLLADSAAADSLDGVAVCATVPSVLHEWRDMLRDHYGDVPHVVVEPGVKTGVPILMDNPREVGADRISNAVAASKLFEGPSIVVDFGTATTFDCVAADGAYVGGAIAPGLALGLDALAARTAKLPRIDLRTPERAIGRDTVSAMQSGTVLGYQALVTGLLTRVRTELADLAEVAPAEVQAILTGGLSAAPWAAALDGIRVIDPDLTLKGLAILHAEVTGGQRLELGLP